MNLTTRLHLVPKLRMSEPYLRFPVRLQEVCFSTVAYAQTAAGSKPGRSPARSPLSPATGRSSERVVTNRIIAGIVCSNETTCSHTALTTAP
jgi:hypothetical protein